MNKTVNKPVNNLSTIVIFDWDNTLYPSSAIDDNIFSTEDIEKLDKIIYKLLNHVMKYAQVLIITNATKNWVYKCLENLNFTRQLIDDIKIISARDLLSGFNDVKHDVWKVAVFEYIITTYYNSANNIISIGDDIYEYKALVNLAKKTLKTNILSDKKFKTVKMFKYPEIDLFIRELNLIREQFYKIYETRKNMDLMIKEN